MILRLKLWLAGLLAAAAGAFALYSKGRADARARVKADMAAAKINALETAREVKADVDQKPADDVRSDLRKWMRRDP